MVRAVESGVFDVVTLANGIGVLELENKVYRWANPDKAGVLELIDITNRAISHMSTRTYKLIEVSNEEHYYGVMHLELMYTPYKAQGYLLPSGLPKYLGDKKPVIPTNELIIGTFSIKNLIVKLRMFDSRRIKPAEGTA